MHRHRGPDVTSNFDTWASGISVQCFDVWSIVTGYVYLKIFGCHTG